jgi:signal transduction histidine kinase
MQPQSKQKQIQLSIKTTIKSSTNHSLDKTRIQQVIINLLTNSIKFSSTGSKIKIFSKVKSSTREADFIQIKVSDEGLGIDSADLMNLFTPFYCTKN